MTDDVAFFETSLELGNAANLSLDREPLEFAPLVPEHLELLRETLAPLPSYSDFDATSLWCWSVEGSTEIAFPQGGVVVRTPDYLTGELSIWAAASSNADHVLHAALDEAHSVTGRALVTLVPESTIERLAELSHLCIEHLADQDDYIIDVATGCDVSRWPRKRRRALRDFNAAVGVRPAVGCCSLDEAIESFDLIDVINRWQRSAQLDDRDVALERAAIERLFESTWLDKIEVITIEAAGLGPIGFSIVEVVKPGVGVVHFAKADRSIPGTFAALTLAEREWALSRRLSRLNIEQDLGLPGLRASKLAERPSSFLRKYSVART